MDLIFVVDSRVAAATSVVATTEEPSQPSESAILKLKGPLQLLAESGLLIPVSGNGLRKVGTSVRSDKCVLNSSSKNNLVTIVNGASKYRFHA